ncbi:MAG: UvrD-helicase domain-containing protein [Caldilineaceae bacterium]|nr:UvrD-helicase domain-containing protein [Caldilineaceae bacterium]
MEAAKHPEYAQEQSKLEDTISSIDAELATLAPPFPAYGADDRAAAAIYKHKLDKMQRLKNARKEPYFGRVDWKSDRYSGPETFYVAKFAIPEKNIFSWRDTMPARLYYEGQCAEPGRRLLRRTYKIDRDRITDIYDDFVAADRADLIHLASSAATVSPVEGSDDLLLQLLEQTREGRLHDIVASIQEEQFRLIRSPLAQILVIQGAPGSGKTAIALHRLAYLLYQYERQGQFSRKRILLLGPNPIFMNYVARVLPELGEGNIPQTTFDDWLVQKLGEQLSYEPEEAALETLMNPNVPLPIRVMRYRNARNKGSMRMVKLLKRYADYLAEQIVTDLGDFEFQFAIGRLSPQSITCTISTNEIRTLLRQVWDGERFSTPLNQCKSIFAAVLTLAALSQLKEKTAEFESHFGPDKLENRRRNEVNNWVTNYLRLWKTLKATVAYRALFRSPDLLHRLGRDIFNRWDLELMHLDAPKQDTPFRFGDLGALLYLHVLLNGVNSSEYLHHIVIDEAQDVTPIQFAVLSHYSRNQSMTIIGDLSQSIYADHGLHSWDELNEFTDKSVIRRHIIRQSYRSTEPIIRFANEMLTRCGITDEFLAEPIARRGPQPYVGRFVSEEDQLNHVSKTIKAELSQGRTSIAVITKSAEKCRELALKIRKSRMVKNVQLIDRREILYEGGVVVIPPYLAKGLEFDVVIVPDADGKTYAPTLLDLRLLFVALTRASHSLYVGWIGEQTPLIRSSAKQIRLVDFYEERLAPELDTIEALASKPEISLDPDYCVERLASENKLRLLQDSLFDRTTLAVMASSWNRRNADDETVVPELNPQLEDAIRTQVSELAKLQDRITQEALAFMQLTYGLLHNVLRSIGIVQSNGEDLDLHEQAVVLARFLNAIRTTDLAYPVGARTTERRTLQFVREPDRNISQQFLHRLIDYGMVERFAQSKGDRICVSYEWMESLVLVALGYNAEQWDADLWGELPHLPIPIGQQLFTHVLT